ncbi:MAG: cytochrome c3 family protein [bacterium]|nr:cytochrome c3 family protein [bacterium]
MKVGLSIIFIVLLLFASCSDRNQGSVLDPSTGRHYGNWISDHRENYLEGKNDCTVCHGNDLKGGISNVSCFSLNFGDMSCHPEGPPSMHPSGWRKPSNHGASAKSAPDFDPEARKGFSRCQKCHGNDFSGGIANISCFVCHGVNAPHPKKPWRSDKITHQTTNIANVPVCSECHTNGANSTHKPDIIAPSGTLPGCFNGTLCHSGENE